MKRVKEIFLDHVGLKMHSRDILSPIIKIRSVR